MVSATAASTISRRRKLVSGGVSGTLSCTLLAPMERVRLLMMTNETPLSLGGACRKAVSHTSGARASLWMGNGMACAKIAPKAGILLYSFDAIQSRIAANNNGTSPVLARFVAGGCAGMISEVCIYPMSVMRTRLATGMYKGVQDCVRSTYQQGGPRAFYRGLAFSVAGIVPYAGIDLTVNSLLKDQAKRYISGNTKNTDPLPIPVMMACGMGSSATSSLLTFPTLVVRTKAQATGLPITAVVRILSNEGVLGFYRGLVPSLMRVMPGAAVTYTTYDLLNNTMASASS